MNNEIRFNTKDKSGNALYIVNDVVNLKLVNKNYSIKLGQLFKHKNGKYSLFKEDKEKGVYRKTNAWSIPFKLLEKLDESVNIRTEKAIYRISVSDALKFGSFLHFKSSGIEQKIYIPIKYWSIELK